MNDIVLMIDVIENRLDDLLLFTDAILQEFLHEEV